MTDNLFDNILSLKTIAISVAIVFILLFSSTIYLLYAPVVRWDLSLIEINIESGDGLKVIAKKLYNLGLIRSESHFVLYVKVRGEEDDLRAGRYLFSKSMNIPAIVLSITSGNSETDDITITIPEGFNIWEVDKLLAGTGLIVEGQFSSKYYNDEGYLFPDSYRVSDDKLKFTIEELRGKMRANLGSKTQDLFRNLSIEEKKRILIIASILEKEAKIENDMRLVSGIIYKRLELGMPLQIDATVIYGACWREAAKSNFTKNCDVTFQGPAAEIKIDGPYNTYIQKGLSPASISNPGLTAIRSALNPQMSNYLYYLSTRDGSQMIYSKTAGEHGANRRKYLGI